MEVLKIKRREAKNATTKQKEGNEAEKNGPSKGEASKTHAYATAEGRKRAPFSNKWPSCPTDVANQSGEL
jgi:hypothetical protein